MWYDATVTASVSWSITIILFTLGYYTALMTLVLINVLYSNYKLKEAVL